ncbi:MAG: glycosyltransferase family 4 protein [Symploca sp. SIO3E6]|nr:glycosyltransferase family 4 protein [Caldora sp. SIO3E6]
MVKTLRVLYAAGPGDVLGTYKYWVTGQDDPLQVSVTYSGQFYDACKALNAQAYVISYCGDRQLLQEEQFTIEHRPKPLTKASGLLYHVRELWYGLGLIATAIRFRANVALVSDGTTHWFVLSLLSWLGVQVIPSVHCVLWRQNIPQKVTEKWLLRLSRNLFTKNCVASLAVSDDISEQIKDLTSGQHKPILRFSPLYRKTQFEGISRPDKNCSPFRVLFVGRIETVKGVFDLLEIAKRFVSEGIENITFDLCGTGSELESLRLAAKEAGLDPLFVCHGHCNKSRMREMFSQSHVVIVPTRTEFAEGFNKVVAEGILSGRPVVTSSVCPSLAPLQKAIVEVPPNDVKSYGDALLKLYNEREFYEEKCEGCLELQKQFYDPSRSWGAKLQSIFVAIQEKRELSEYLDSKQLNSSTIEY